MRQHVAKKLLLSAAPETWSTCVSSLDGGAAALEVFGMGIGSSIWRRIAEQIKGPLLGQGCVATSQDMFHLSTIIYSHLIYGG